MTTRLVPYRHFRQVIADGNIVAVLMTVGAFGTSLLSVSQNFLIKLLAVGGTLVLCTLIAIAIVEWKTRVGGAELIAPDERTRRFLVERASAPALVSVASMGLLVGHTILVLLLATLPIELWRGIPIAVGIGSILGFIFGGYAWNYSRTFVRANAKAKNVTAGSQVSLPPTPFVQQAMRHYSGYAMGLGVGMFASTMFSETILAWAALGAGFVTGKILSDSLVPAVYYGSAVEGPNTFIGVVYSLLFAMMWWGLPFGTLVSLSINIIVPNPRLSDYLFAFALTSSAAMFFNSFLLLLLRVTQGRVTESQ